MNEHKLNIKPRTHFRFEVSYNYGLFVNSILCYMCEIL